jgi:hypothetical protein
MLKGQLPIGQTFRGVPWCKGDTGPVSDVITAWSWATNTEDLTVFVTPPSQTPRPQGQIEFRWQAVPDGNGREGCTAPLPASVNPELNRPGVSGDSVAWEGWGHVSEFVEEVSAGAA